MISVCMATYNGEKYITQQLDSILSQISDTDELIISDDGSTDKTIDIIQEYQTKYKNIRLLNGPRCGVQKNFENALKHVQGDIVFLCDQDDVWVKGKVKACMHEFETKENILVLHDAYIVDENCNVIEDSLFAHRGSKSGLVKNIIKNSYVGCCMAFRKDLLEHCLPFPDKIEMHDWWIGLVAEKVGKTALINKPYLMYRRHAENVSSFHHHPFKKMVFNRIYFIIQILKVK